MRSVGGGGGGGGGATARVLLIAGTLLCVHACRADALVAASPLGARVAHDPVQRLRGGWAHPLVSDVLAHPVPDVQAQDVAKFDLARTSSQQCLPFPPLFWGGRGGRRRIQPERCSPVADAGVEHSGAADLNSVRQTVVVEASVEECFETATGFEQYPQWAAGIQRFTILERDKSGIAELVEWEMGMFGITTKNSMRYSWQMPAAGRAVLNWHVTEGGVKELVGKYEFVAVGPAATQIVYTLYVDPGFPLPEVVKRATNRAVAKAALQDLKRYTEGVRARRLQDEAESATTSEEETEEDAHSAVPFEAKHLIGSLAKANLKHLVGL